MMLNAETATFIMNSHEQVQVRFLIRIWYRGVMNISLFEAIHLFERTGVRLPEATTNLFGRPVLTGPGRLMLDKSLALRCPARNATTRLCPRLVDAPGHDVSYRD